MLGRPVYHNSVLIELNILRYDNTSISFFKKTLGLH